MRSRQMGGIDLSLAIVKHIAQSHGGQAAVSSKLNVEQRLVWNYRTIKA